MRDRCDDSGSGGKTGEEKGAGIFELLDSVGSGRNWTEIDAGLGKHRVVRGVDGVEKVVWWRG